MRILRLLGILRILKILRALKPEGPVACRLATRVIARLHATQKRARARSRATQTQPNTSRTN
eukprot:4230254-Lingulodinium_polyedra.AAC.1